MALVKPLYFISGKWRELSPTADTVQFFGIGIGIAPNAAARVTTAASTASIAAFLMTPGVAYTGTVNGMHWFETTNNRARVIKAGVATDFITQLNNYLFVGTSAKRLVSANATGDLAATTEISDLFVTDTDIISAINGATFAVTRLATITPANSKVIYQGQKYYNSSLNIYYEAIADNQVYITSPDVMVDSTGKKWRQLVSTTGVISTSAI